MRNWFVSILSILLVACGTEEDKTPLVDRYEYLDSLDKALAENPKDTVVVEDTVPEVVAEWNKFLDIDGETYHDISWANLADITFSEKYYEDVNAYFLYPEFGDNISALSGENIVIKGFMVPIPGTEPDKIYALSKTPFSACFFCGNAGPETVVELEVKDPRAKFEMDKVYAFSGKLRLNNEDINRMNYILEKAEEYELN